MAVVLVVMLLANLLVALTILLVLATLFLVMLLAVLDTFLAVLDAFLVALFVFGALHRAELGNIDGAFHSTGYFTRLVYGGRVIMLSKAHC